MKNELRETKKFISENLKKIFFFVMISMVVIVLVSGLNFYMNPNSAQELIKVIKDQMSGLLDNDVGLLSAKIFLNNLFACAIAIGLGFVPLFCLPAISLISNAVIIGALFGYGEAMGTMNSFESFLFGMLPHGIFELPAIFLSISMGIYLCRVITGKIMGRGKAGVLITLNNIARVYVLVVIPLLIIAAVVEGYVTPYIIGMAGI